MCGGFAADFRFGIPAFVKIVTHTGSEFNTFGKFLCEALYFDSIAK